MERKAFLARVTASLDRRERSATRAGAVPRRDGLPTEPGAIAELFASRLAAVGGYAHHAVTRADAQEDIARMLGERGMASLACPAGLRWSAVETLCTDDAENAAFGLAEAERGVAETGSVMLLHGGENGRRRSLLPPVVGFLLPASRLLPSLGCALDVALGARDRLPACTTFVTGASHSADIACVPCRGVHGPGEVHVWLIDQE